MNRTTPLNKTPLRTSPRFRTGVVSPTTTTAVVSPRKRAISATPPIIRAEKVKRFTAKQRTASGETTSTSSDEIGDDDAVAIAKPTKRKANDDEEAALYYINLDAISYYELLNVPKNATKADITSKVNNLQLVYKKSRPSSATNAVAENTNEKIHSTLGNALQVLSVISNRRIYDRYVNEKDNLNVYFNDNIVPLRKTANEIYSSALRLQNDVAEYYETNVAQLLGHHVYQAIERNMKNIHYKTTITNRLLLEWPVSGESVYDNGGIDEDYLEKYFKDDGVVAIIMCSTRPGCAVVELLTQKNIKNIIDREHERKVFSLVRDFTEAEFGIDHTNYEPQLDKINVLLNDIQELEQKLLNETKYIDSIRDDDDDEENRSSLESIERQLNFTSAFMKMESSGDELDDDDESMYDINDMM
ncbi:ORF111 [Spodoptera exigua multiple nucleopolyhedrovirus]|uniref:ORF111 n=1 Tax=Spodoptera exigua nuclear polyhedrosis virus (strain US) TaxID=31506 RepID=Q9J826_NPVSE|nr:ORF111 [Spodoptera exigua multiple nucleopolyhedrovirus]AAF33640.1 ORF111 [Spodoptera exigua multiple nucleopolyhedrovirus]